MSPLLMSLIVFACVLGGAFLGMFLRNRLPEHHLSAATKDVVRLGTGLIGTIAGLVLGLLIASANSTYETQSSQVQQLTANIVLLDRTLAGRRQIWPAICFVAGSPLWPIGFGAKTVPILGRWRRSRRAPHLYHFTMRF